MSAFDPMAAAVDWLDAYRAHDLSIDDLYTDDAQILCGCGTEKALSGSQERKPYWRARFVDKPAQDLIDISDRGGDVVTITYRTAVDVVQAILSFDAESGLISLHRCGPL
ncbi:nuclear transport factor 2 family protein [Bradyrhizobium sp. BRP19]|uniref:nuclear transport factor 2 family protein n=1 Tax=Bradyrhizobium sp. BRP19 TaxID=2793823 RepID=UPI001CD6828C|nr:nuclear transport factor 2 family protein [Bradyrhizobium sp. BRP19]MCA1552425.1 nuclear transport factor 2 family protein [Bradyrhizobium sp. BRP19]